MANLLADAQNNLANWGQMYQGVRENDERMRVFTQEYAREGNNDENGQVNPAGVLVEDEHSRMDSGLDASLLATLQTFDEHLSLSVGSGRDAFLDELFEQNSADEDDVQIKSRGTSYGAAAADGGNTGNALLHMCGTDQNGDVIESATIETLTFKALASASGPAGLGLETYSIEGNGKSQRSEFLAGGKGTRISGITAVGPGRSSLLTNPSWDLAFSGSGSTKIQGWTIPSGDDKVTIETSTSEIAQDRGETHAALKIVGNCVIRFDFRAENVALSYIAPFIAGIMVKLTAVTADIELRLGSTGTSYLKLNVHSAATQAYTPQVLDPDTANAWRVNFDTDGKPYLEIEVKNYSSGTIRIDDALCEAMQSVGGRPSAIISGQTVTLEGDKFTQTCTLDTGVGSVALTGGGSGNISSITVDGVELLSATITFDTSLAVTAQNAVDNINNHRTFPNYIATRSSDTITITQEIPVTGTLTVVATTSTITTTDTNVSGASLGKIQDSIVRRTGKYLPHASSASSGWGDHA